MKSEKSIVGSVKEVKNGSIVLEITLDNVFDVLFYTLLIAGAVVMAMDGTLVSELVNAVVIAYILSQVQS